jgi:hypothetical protein
MEEQKTNKVVKMQPVNGEQKEEAKAPKFTYDQLKEMADKLWNENRYLKQQLQEAMQFANTVNRLDYLFKVIEIANTQSTYSFNSDFIQKCIDEVESIMVMPEQKETKED